MIRKKINIKKIVSSQNPIIKQLVKLRKSRKAREESHSALVTEKKIIQELAQNIRPKTVLSTDKTLLIPADETYLVTEPLLKKITGLPAPEGIVAEFPLPKPATLKGMKRVIVLDSLSDPGNLGTILRTALALGWEGVFLLPGCVDPFNEKALRASRGGVFRLPMRCGPWQELKTLARKNQLIPYIADTEGENIQDWTAEEKILLILSSEAHGPSEREWGKKITIPMTNKMESLNVAVAGGILMYHLSITRP